ncbi:MAG: glycine cleavage system protein GcvH [candidate division KSB1 bacterium]|nr:glycine cleavage system protein GcvH [candidate division KSB1 bacterium]
MTIPADLLYTKEHEWVRMENDVATIGITDYAQSELGDIVYVELPAVDSETVQMNAFGTIEAVKTVSDLFAPLTGKVIAVNSKLSEQPELINTDCYGEGWMIKIKIANPQEIKQLLSPKDYEAMLT